MSASFKELILSDSFAFVVGKEQKSVTVHSSIIAAQSPVLAALINGNMREARARSAEIYDFELDDFVRFCEHAYRGDYTIPPYETTDHITSGEECRPLELTIYDSAPKPPPPPPPLPAEWPEEPPAEEPPAEEPPAEAPIVDQDWGGWGLSRKNKKSKSKKAVCTRTLRDSFNARSFCSSGPPRERFVHFYAPIPNTSPAEKLTPVLLVHARLYVFAQKYLIKELKQLALYKLHKTLLGFSLYISRVEDIIELARFIYADNKTPGTTESGGMDELRNLVVEYIGSEIEIIGKTKAFFDLVEEGGEFAREFWAVVQKYIITGD